MQTVKKLIQMINESELTKTEMAKRSGISRQAIHNIVTGKRKDLKISTIESLMKVLKK